MTADFVHLRLHTEYSVSDGTVRIDDLIRTARDDAMVALAITDLANLFAAVKFYRAARAAGVKPIIGADVFVSNADGETTRLLLLCRNRAGYLRLCELISKAYLGEQPQGKPAIDANGFDEGDNSGLIALCGGRDGAVTQALLRGKFDLARETAKIWAERFPGRFYLEIQRAGFPDDEAVIDAVLDVADREGLPVVATHPVQFLRESDALAHDARVCIAEKETLNDPKRLRRYLPSQYFLTRAQMTERFADLSNALLNTVEIARCCNFEFELGVAKLPRFPTPDGVSLDDFLTQEAQKGLESRLSQLFDDPAILEAKRPEYLTRLDFELQTIIQMGFPGYFLIVADFIRWAKAQGIPVGPGRGSGAGSLVAYSLQITDLDPIRYDLLFERFLNPERVSMPDFDIDFCQDGRDRVIDYVRQRYGADAVSQIATFGTMAAKAVVRDVGRVLGLPYSRTDEIAKLIPFDPTRPVTLTGAYEEVPELAARKREDEEIAELLDLAEQCEGLVRNIGMHAGGVLIAPGKLTDFCPLYCAAGSTDIVSQFDKNDVEAVGLVKFDFLGLKTLTVLSLALTFLKDTHPDYADFSLEALPLDDPTVYKVFCDGNTTGVFQSESRSAKDLEKKLKPDCFEDLIALMALNRPGPLQSGMVDDFINRKHGLAKPEYFHPSLEPALKPTYGVIVYQEQVMQIARVLAGFSLGKADFLRRAMGKKDAKKMAEMGDEFRQGAIDRQIDPKIADELFSLMAKFAEYGFNRSHSAAYALIAYQTAWFKAYFPAEFIAATLTMESGSDKFALFEQDARQNGVTILPPDVNLSIDKFAPVDSKTIRFGLAAVKGVGEAVARQIVETRSADGPYADYFDFCARLSKKHVNRRVLEALICAGTFDSLENDRHGLMASIDLALQFAEQNPIDSPQDSLFGHIESVDRLKPALVKTTPWSIAERLSQEKRALGLYMTGHPFDAYQDEIRRIVTSTIGNLTSRREPVTVAGIITTIRIQKGRRGKMAVVTIDDQTGTLEVVVFSELLASHPLTEDGLLIVTGKISYDDYAGGYRLTADSLESLETIRASSASGLTLKLDSTVDVDWLVKTLEPYRQPDGASLIIDYKNDRASCRLQAGNTWTLSLQPALIDGLKAVLPAGAVTVRYADRRS